MLRNYWLAAARNLRKNRGFSILNIAGLAVGIACAALILLWVEDEVEYDHSIPDHNRISRVMERQLHDGKMGSFNATPAPLGPGILAEIPGIRRVGRTNNSSQLTQALGVGEKVITEQGEFGDSSLLSMLNLQFVHGAAAHAFDQLHSIVISESLAEKLFGSDDPVWLAGAVCQLRGYDALGEELGRGWRGHLCGAGAEYGCSGG
jgi:putative ABC transport system permease protein